MNYVHVVLVIYCLSVVNLYRIIVLRHFSFSYYIKKVLLVLIFSYSWLHVVEDIIDLNL